MFRVLGAIVLLVLVATTFIFFQGQLSGPQRMPIAQPNNSFAIRDVTLFDGERVLTGTSIIVENGVITALGDIEQATNETYIYDGRKKFVIPGLIDSHIHVIDPNFSSLKDALRFGVTTVFDQYTSLENLAARKRTQTVVGKTPFASLYSAGTLVTSPGGHGTQFGMDIPTITLPEDAQRFVADRLAEGSDWIKIVYEPTADLVTSIDEKVLRAVIAAARQQNTLAVVHISTKEAARQALLAGAHGLVHVFADEVADQAMIDLMYNNQVFVIPTLSVIASFSDTPREQLATDKSLSPYLRRAQRDGLGVSYDVPQEDKATYDLDIALTNIRLFHEAGITILAGTDAPSAGTADGVSVHGELALLVRAGLSPEAALKAATSSAADAFKIGDRGRIQVGMPADLVMLKGDPTKEIQNTRSIHRIWKNGYEIGRDVFGDDSKAGKSPELQSGIVSTFDDDSLKTTLGHKWEKSTDEVISGASTAEFGWEVRAGDVQSGLLGVVGVISTKSPWPWSGVGVLWGDSPETSYDFSNYEYLVFEARGTPRNYSIFLTSRTSARMPLECQPLCQENLRMSGANTGWRFETFVEHQ